MKIITWFNLLQVVKEQQKEIEDLKNRVEALEA